MPMSRPLTILFMPESAYGPTNQCIGIGDVLRRRGHQVVFAAEASWRGKLEALGFAEDLVELAPAAEDGTEADAGQFWKDFIRDTAPEFRRPTIEQLEHVHGAHLAGTHRRRRLLRATAARDHRALEAGRGRRGQRRLLPGADHLRRTLRAHRVLQPAGDEGPRGCPRVLRLPGSGPVRLGGVPQGVRAHPPGHVGRVQRVRGTGRRPAAGSRVHPRQHVRNLYVFPAEADYTDRGRWTRPGTAWTPASGRPTPCTGYRPRWPTDPRAAR